MSWLEESVQSVSTFVAEAFSTSEWFRVGISLLGLVVVAIIGTGLIMGYDKIHGIIINSRLYTRWKINRLKKEVSLLSKTLFKGEYEEEIHLILSKACSYLSIGVYGFIVHGLKKTTLDQFERMRLGALLKYVANSKDNKRIKTLEGLLFELRSNLMAFNAASEDWEVSDDAYSWTVLTIFKNEACVRNPEYILKLEQFSKLLQDNKSMKPNDVVNHFLSD